jgi:hypothetical protein
MRSMHAVIEIDFGLAVVRSGDILTSRRIPAFEYGHGKASWERKLHVNRKD